MSSGDPGQKGGTYALRSVFSSCQQHGADCGPHAPAPPGHGSILGPSCLLAQRGCHAQGRDSSSAPQAAEVRLQGAATPPRTGEGQHVPPEAGSAGAGRQLGVRREPCGGAVAKLGRPSAAVTSVCTRPVSPGLALSGATEQSKPGSRLSV